ncbi:MAG TPA: DHA2 family efflux MFS transporter permease subunit [Caulobacteraceae bacterium]
MTSIPPTEDPENIPAGEGVAEVVMAEPSGIGRQLAILAVGSALFMQFIDQTALSTALPTLAVAFKIPPIDLKLVLTSYILVQAVVVPASGWAADRYGARRIFIAAMAVFLLGSVLCGLSRTLGELVLFRILQGAGAAMIMPVGRIIVVGQSPREQLVKAMALLTTPAMVGPIIGPPLTGLILKIASWPWIFYINVPVGILGMIAVWKFVPRTRQPHPGRFDTLGFVLAALAMSTTMGLAETVGFNLIPWTVQVAALVVAVASIAGFIHHARRAEKPVLDLSLLRLKTFRASCTGGALIRIGIGATPFLMPLLLQIAMGWSPLQAGSLTIGMAIGALLSRPLATRLMRRFGFRTILVWTAGMVACFTMAPGFFRTGTPVWIMFAILAVGGFVRATQFTASNSLSFAEVDQQGVTAASTLQAVILQLSISMGITVGSLALQLARLNAGPQLTASQFTLPFCFVGLLSLLAVPVYARLHRDIGADMTGHRRR